LIKNKLVVKQAACAFSMAKRQVLNIQQQVRGMDCGLFAIAFTQIFCSGAHPSHYMYLQTNMRQELAKSLEAKALKVSFATLL